MVAKGSLPHSQEPATCPYPEPDRFSSCPLPPNPTSIRSILIFSSHLRLGLSIDLFPSGFPNKALYAPLLAPYVLHAPPICFLDLTLTPFLFTYPNGLIPFHTDMADLMSPATIKPSYVFMWSAQYFSPILLTSGFPRQLFIKVPNTKVHADPFSGSRGDTYRQTDGRTWTSETLLASYANAPKMDRSRAPG
jgi:hypothetical protein